MFTPTPSPSRPPPFSDIDSIGSPEPRDDIDGPDSNFNISSSSIPKVMIVYMACKTQFINPSYYSVPMHQLSCNPDVKYAINLVC